MAARRRTLTNEVYDHVYAAIVNGQLTSNDLLTEAQLQVSKAPVREALLMLCQANILQVLPRIGYRVVQISPAQVQKLAESRLVLERYMLERAWPAIGEAQVARLTEVNERQRAIDRMNADVLSRWMGNIDFHLTLAGFCDNEYLLEALRTVLHTFARATTQGFLGLRPGRLDVDSHAEIIQALSDGSLQAALSALTEDINQFA